MSYIGNSPGNASQRVVTRKVATAGQTRFASDSGYATGYVDVIVNGADLVAGEDFNETGDGINIDLVEACAADDSVKIIAWIPRGLSDGYTKPEANALLALKADLVAGKIPSSQLPAYVDDVLEYANLAAFPATGSAGIIYVAQDTNNCYRWSGSAYIVLTDLSSYYTKTQADALLVPATVSDKTNTSTGYFDLPAGTTAQRPASPEVGMMRLNTQIKNLEYYDGTLWRTPADAPYSIEFLTVAGGGAGGTGNGGSGGGGAGGYVATTAIVTPTTSYSAVVGAGGAGIGDVSDTVGNSGSNSSFSNLVTAIGGGGGGAWSNKPGLSGGSGGGGGGFTASGGSGTSGQGNSGGTGNNSSAPYSGGGGGGAGASGQSVGAGAVANGGTGLQWLNGSYYAGGGGAGTEQSGYTSQGLGGNGGGGRGGYTNTAGISGTANTGGGGGGGGYPTNRNNGSGGSGIVIIRYAGAQRGTGGTVTSSGGYTYHTFTSSGTFTA